MMPEEHRGEIERLVEQGYITKKRKGDLSLYNYTPKTQYEDFWCKETLMCRGLILSNDNQIVARPFDKFFNWGEGGRTTDAPAKHVWEKMDGSLGCGFAWKDEWHVATRGSFDGEQAQWAQERFRRMMDGREPFACLSTFLFEIIYPENRIVVDYGGVESLVLLAVRRNQLGDYWPQYLVDFEASRAGFGRPAKYRTDSVDDIQALCEKLDANHEGFVAEFEDGSRFKFKTEAYKELHRLISGLTWKNTVAAARDGTVDQVREVIPDEFLGQFNEWVGEIEYRKQRRIQDVEMAFDEAPRDDRKTFAEWVQRYNKDIAPYLFQRYDERDYTPLIFKREMDEPEDEEE